MSSTTLIFFEILSNNVKFTLGKRIASGIPGKPPPVQTSRTSVPSTNS